MSVLQKVSFLPNERLDTNDVRALSAFNLNDWRFFLSGAFNDRSLILAGFEITNYDTIFTVPGFKLKISDAVVFHTEATTQAAGFYSAVGTEADISVTLAPSATNFVEMDFGVVSGTPDVRAFWDQGANSNKGGEFTDTVDTVINLEIGVTSNISGFTPGKIPLYKVVTDSLGVVTSVTDVRPLFFRLGAGGQTPDPSHDFDWPELPDASHARLETPITATSATATNAPFQGGDKNIQNFKAWLDAVMTSIKEIKGTPYWYMSGGTLSIPSAYQNAALTVLIGGTWEHLTLSLGHLALVGGSTVYRLGRTNNPILSAFTDIDLTTQRVLFVLLPTADVAVTYGFGQDGLTPIIPKSVTGVSSSTITVSTGGNYATGGGTVLAHGVEFAYASYTAGTGLFAGVTPDPSGTVIATDDVYQLNNGSTGYYHNSVSSKVPGLIGAVSEGAERVLWLAVYDGSTVIQLKNGDLEQGEQIEVGDNTSLNLLNYVGSPSEATNDPTYSTTATGAKTGQTNYNSVSTDDLTVRDSRLTSMMADKAQDKTIELFRFNVTDVTNTTNGANQDITFTGSTPELRVLVPSSSNNGTIGLGSTLSLAVGQAAYFEVDRNAAFSISDMSGLTVSSGASVPLNENVFLFAWRHTNGYIYLWDGRRFGVGTSPINQEFSDTVFDRLGLTSENSFQAYTSTFIIGLTDSYPEALSALDASVNAILTDTADEEEFIVTNPLGQTVFDATLLTWDPSNTIPDISVRRGGDWLKIDPAGAFARDYRKNSSTQIEFAYTIPQNAEIVIRQERTGGTGGGGGGGGGEYAVHGTEPSPVTITAAGGLSATSEQRQLWFVKSTGGAVSITANPQIVAGTIIGQELTVVGVSAVDYITFMNGTGLSINGPVSLHDNGAITFVWTGVVWREISRR